MNAAIEAVAKKQRELEAALAKPVVPEPVLTSLSLTHVTYNASSKLSTLSAFLALVPQALVIVYVTTIWSTREIEVLLMFAGQMVCEALNFGLKRWLQEERPSRTHTYTKLALIQ